MTPVAVSLAVLSEKTVPTTSTLFRNACCPSLDLVALAPAASPPTLSLSRTTAKPDQVWEYSTPKPPVKGKPAPGPQGEITAIAWDPAGASAPPPLPAAR